VRGGFGAGDRKLAGQLPDGSCGKRHGGLQLPEMPPSLSLGEAFWRIGIHEDWISGSPNTVPVPRNVRASHRDPGSLPERARHRAAQLQRSLAVEFYMRRERSRIEAPQHGCAASSGKPRDGFCGRSRDGCVVGWVRRRAAPLTQRYGATAALRLFLGKRFSRKREKTMRPANRGPRLIPARVF
jgi:hypothetical protein